MTVHRFISILFLAFALNSHAANAVDFPKPPKTAYYIDAAKLISSADAQAINNIASKLWLEQQVPLYVVTIPSLVQYKASNLTIEQYTQQLFDKWQIGSKDRNFGILLLVSKGDRAARIEFGAAWQGMHDNDAQYIMDSLMVPKFKQGEYSQGIVQGVSALDALARGLSLPKPELPKWLIPALIGGVIAFILLIVSLFRSGRKGWAWGLLAVLGTILFFMFKAAGTSAGIGRGGSSGGGGATGRW